MQFIYTPIHSWNITILFQLMAWKFTKVTWLTSSILDITKSDNSYYTNTKLSSTTILPQSIPHSWLVPQCGTIWIQTIFI